MRTIVAKDWLSLSEDEALGIYELVTGDGHQLENLHQAEEELAEEIDVTMPSRLWMLLVEIARRVHEREE